MSNLLSLLLLCGFPFPLAGRSAVDAGNICRHIEVLASDDFQGRQIATPGEEKTIAYISRQFKEIGLEPATGGGYLQEIELARYTPVPPAVIDLEYAGAQATLRHREDFLLASTFPQERILIEDAELIFAGFGIYAPEIGWDDYKSVDVSGKIVVVLAGVPGEYTTDEELWKGDPAANLYAKTFYKKNEAASRGALGLLTIYKQSQQGLYTWESLGQHVGVNDLTIKRSAGLPQLQFSGLLSPEAAARLFTKVDIEERTFQTMALQPGFQPFSLQAKAHFSFSNKWEEVLTHNVAGLLPGRDLADEVMIYSAHWDHVGILPGAAGDSIRNGAIDNASGTAALIEIARAFKAANDNRRSILFLATGAEEVGLLGSVWYNAHPLFPAGKTAANFNMDAHYPYGKSSHITAVVYGRSELDRYLEEAARRQGRTLVSNDPQNIAADIFFRSDHFPFIEQGIPAEFAVGFGEAVGHDNDVYQKKLAAYAYKYHQPGDEYEEDFNCEGIAQDAAFILLAGQLIDRQGDFPQWYEDQPFHRYRQASRYESSHFKDVTPTHTPLISTQGRTMDARPVDIDQDGDLDLILAGEFSYNILLINDGRGRFTDETRQRLPLKRHDSEDIAVADFNRDGFPDLVIVSEDDLTNEYYLNDGRGVFIDHSHRLPVQGKSNAVNTLDLNGDGYPDLLIGNDGRNSCLLNDQNGGWTECPERIPDSAKTTQDIEVGDLNGDGHPDIICGNEDDNEIWINDGRGYFRDETASRLPLAAGAWETREADLGDIDGDGDLDLLLANVNFRQTKDPQNRLFENDGRGYFTERTATHLPAEQLHSVDGDFADLDGDGDLDIITANSFGDSFNCYLNDGHGRYSRATESVLPASVRGDGIDVEAADFNGDGKLDLYLCNFRGSDLLLLGK